MTDTPPKVDQGIWRLLGSALWTAIPIASVFAFLAAAIKVFRASGMETSTTVAIIGAADDVQLLKGVLVSLLPGFITGVIAVAIWEWARHLPKQGFAPGALHDALIGPRAIVMFVLMWVGAFTIAVLAWLPLFVATTALYVAVFVQSRRQTDESTPILARARSWIVALSLVTSIGSVLLLALAHDVWLPLRDVEVVQGHDITVGDRTFTHHVAAYVLSSDDTTTTLLLDLPRAVVTIPTAAMRRDPAICVPSRKGGFWLLQRPSQALRWDGKFPTPYQKCPPGS